MKVLGIETSCDETAVAVVEFQGTGAIILAEKVSSQSELHREYGGVVPELASREHLRNLPLLLESLLKERAIDYHDLSVIGVTRGPGLKGCLLVGLGVARGLSLASGIPLVGVNHIEGHIFSGFLNRPELKFPYLCIVASGGHTEIHLVEELGSYALIARTIDDAAGEAFDKSANLLGFEYPGGPRLAAMADSAGKTSFKLPRVMRGSKDFSFSGLKTAIALLIKGERERLSESRVRGELAFAIQEAIVDELISKTRLAMEESGVNRVALAGGVAANQRLRSELSKVRSIDLYLSRPAHCMDNAAMIAYVAGLRFMRGERLSDEAEVLARWPVESMGVAQ